MQPMGRKPVRFPGKIDWHIRKCKNWWEDEHEPNRKTERQDVKKEIKEDLINIDNSLIY